MLERVRRLAFAALCMCMCVNMKARAEEYVMDEMMMVAAEQLNLGLEEGKSLPGGYTHYIAYIHDKTNNAVLLYNETDSTITVNANTATITAKTKNMKYVNFWNLKDVNEYINGRIGLESARSSRDLTSAGVYYVDIKATNQTFVNSEGTVIRKPNVIINGGKVELEPTTPKPEPGPETGPGPGGEGGSGEGESSNVPWYKRIIEMIASIPEKLIEGIKALFVPSEEALKEHERLFNEKFNFWSGIKEQFEKIVGMLQGNGIPPKIEMDLSRIGAGKVTVLNFEGIDLTLFKKLESAFLWLSYILLLFRNVTGIIKGETTEVKE